MSFVTFIGLKRAIRGISKVAIDLEGNERISVMNRIGRALRDQTRANITNQSYEGRPWKPLAPMTKARTGRRKALITEREKIAFKATKDRVEVYHQSSDPTWNLTKHHFGFRVPGVRGKLMAVPLRNPGAIGSSKSVLFFSRRKAFDVPARPVWPSKKRIRAIAEPIAKAFLQRIARK